jgi:type VI secretion system secreted protein Hcp
LLLVGAACGGATLAVAGVPDNTGVIHACYEVSDSGQTTPEQVLGNVRVIDPAAGQACGTVHAERPLNWNVAGPPGAPGAQGQAGAQGAQGPAGTGLTIAGPTVKSTAPPVGHMTLGTGRHALSFDIIALGFASSSAQAAGAHTAKATFNDLTIKKPVDSSSAKLFSACASGAHYKKVTISLRKAGGDPGSTGKPFLTYTLTDIRMSSYQLAPGGAGKAKPLETVTLHFGAVSHQP